MGYRRPVPSRTLDLLRKNILARLRERGERQGDLAKGVGKSDAWISQVLTGKRAIRLNLIDRVAEYFECDLDALFADRSESLPLTKPAMSGGLHVETRRTPRPGARPRIENSVDRLWEEFDRHRATLDAVRVLVRTLHTLIERPDSASSRVPKPAAGRRTRDPHTRLGAPEAPPPRAVRRRKAAHH